MRASGDPRGPCAERSNGGQSAGRPPRKPTRATALGNRQPLLSEAARWRLPDVTGGGYPFPVQGGSSDCSGIRDCERAGHSGQEGETRGCSAWLSGWPGAQLGAELRALRASPGAAAQPGSAAGAVGGGPRCPDSQVSLGDCPWLGFQRATGPPPPRDQP